jgi:hypothetical protein
MVGSETKLIVNADDLGRTPGVDSDIFDAHSRGLVTTDPEVGRLIAAKNIQLIHFGEL